MPMGKRIGVTADYYTCAPEDERRDEIEWGEFALAQFEEVVTAV